jgi:ABC-type transport system substrate-binding protein
VAGGFEVRVNPYVQLVAQDGPDVMEAVALDWEKIGIKVKRVPESTSSFGPKGRMRKTGKTFSVYGAPPFDEPWPDGSACSPPSPPSTCSSMAPTTRRSKRR